MTRKSLHNCVMIIGTCITISPLVTLVHRRKEMEKEIERHELERKLTARPGELDCSQDDDEYGGQVNA